MKAIFWGQILGKSSKLALAELDELRREGLWSRRVGDPILDAGRNQLAGVEAGRLGD